MQFCCAAQKRIRVLSGQNRPNRTLRGTSAFAPTSEVIRTRIVEASRHLACLRDGQRRARLKRARSSTHRLVVRTKT